MKTSERLYGKLDSITAKIQFDLFIRKKAKAYALIKTLRPKFDVGSFTQEQRDLEFRLEDIKKAIEFCNGQIAEAKEILNVS